MIAAVVLSAAIHIEAADRKLTVPPQIPSGLNGFVFENHGAEPHYVRFVRIADGRTFDDVVKWQATGDPIPNWLEPAGGVGTVAPGGSEQYFASLAPGSYVALCTYPTADRTGHYRTGEYARLQVGPEQSSALSPEDDLTLKLHDHGFQLTSPVTQGKLMWHVQNGGTEPHQALIVRLPDNVSEFSERSWLAGTLRGAEPGQPVGGLVDLPAGGEAWFELALTPGKYLLLCSMLEEEGRHFDLGMIYRFTVE